MKKRAAAIVIAAILAVIVLTAVFAETQIQPTVSDILDYIVGNTDNIPEGADYNKDGKIDVLDAIEAKRGSDGKLKLDSLTLSDGTLEPEFSSSIYSYTVDLPDGRPVIPLVEAESDVHDVEIYQAYIPDGQNEGTARITVSEGSETNVYTVTFRRRAENGFVLQYDDRYDISSRPELEGQTGVTYVSSDPAKVSVDETGMLKACARTETPVTVTASKDGNALFTLSVDKVVKARLNLFFVTGQSTAQGCYDTSDTSGNRIPTDVQHSLIEDIGRSGAVYGFDVFPRSENPQVYSLRYNLYDLNEHAKQGFEPSLGKYFYELSGEKILFFQSAYSGAPIEAWLDTDRHSEGGKYASGPWNFYDKTQEYYPVMLEQLGDNFEIIRTCNVWYQGATGMTAVYDYETSNWITSSSAKFDGSKKITEEQYYNYFMLMHNDMIEDFGMKYNFLVLNRIVSGVCSAENRRTQFQTDIVPVKQAQLALVSNDSDVILVSRLAEWSRMYSSPDTETYGYGFIGLDNTHSNQIGYNENGKIIGTNAFERIFGTTDESAPYIDVFETDGRTRLTFDDTVEIRAGETYVTGAIAEPISAGYDVIWSSSDESVATVDRFGNVKAISEGVATITASSTGGAEGGFKVSVLPGKTKDQVDYLWDFNDLTSSLDKNDLTVSDYTVAQNAVGNYTLHDGMLTQSNSLAAKLHPDFMMENPINFDSTRDWYIEWRAKLTRGSILMGNPTPDGDATTPGYFYLAYSVNFNTKDPENPLYPLAISLGNKTLQLSYGDYKSANTSMNTWRIEYSAASNTITVLLKQNDEFVEVNSASAGTFDFECSCLFGRFKGGTMGINGDVDYIRVHVDKGEGEPTRYFWDFVNLNTFDFDNELTVSPYCVDKGTDKNFTVKNGIYSMNSGTKSGDRTDFILEKPIELNSNRSWTIEWRSKLNGSSVLFGSDTPAGQSTIAKYIYLSYTAKHGNGNDYSLKFSFASGNTGAVFLLYGDYKSANSSWNTWRLSFDRKTSVLKLELLQDGAYVTVDSKTLPEYSMTLPCMFGRFKDASTGFQGSIDWIKVTLGEEKND